jgi:ribose 5-phosphate isomerase B
MKKTERLTIFIGADHRGFGLKARVIALIKSLGHEPVDAGSYSAEPCDYPAISREVALNVARVRNARGILICLTGVGHSIAANKVRGAYAALCHNMETAILSRQHNDANILVLGSNFLSEKEIDGMIRVWLATAFEGGRHLRRVKQIRAMEKELFK